MEQDPQRVQSLTPEPCSKINMVFPFSSLIICGGSNHVRICMDCHFLYRLLVGCKQSRYDEWGEEVMRWLINWLDDSGYYPLGNLPPLRKWAHTMRPSQWALVRKDINIRRMK